MAVSRTDDRGVVEVFDADAYKRTHPDAELVTDGGCGRTWDDAVVTSSTPVPSGRCPFEYDHEDEETGGAFTLRIDLGNDAMQTPADVGRALEAVARQIADDDWTHGADGPIRDANGNRVGRWDVE